MSPRELSNAPNLFLKRFSFIAVLSSLVLLLLSGFASFKLYERYVLRLAESNASNLAVSIMHAHREILDNALAKPFLPNDEILHLDKTLRAFLTPYGILKIKLFAPSNIVVYSNDFEIIGKGAVGNKHLEIALSGGRSSTIQTKDQVHDMAAENRFDVDVVESYVPMRDESGSVIGVFEIYQDMTEFRAEVNQGVLLFMVGISIILFCVVITAYIFMHSTARKLLSQQHLLEQLATIDSVTNIYNRAEITRRIEAEWERFRRGCSDEKGFGILMLDIDHFKQVNDQYGHQVGDELLRYFAHRLQGELRLYSDLGRYGGEEFIVLLPEVSEEQLMSVAERVLMMVSAEPFQINGYQIPLTVSIGIALASHQDLNPDAVIKRSDEHLYRAKEKGRNCISAAQNTAPAFAV
ncbi:diguanylate cyclase [uncultured Neptuniibacter sp.]|uniref:GGDEF domain-containing protein n=1 Tax=uncultured Neptuniibacter sp. TaxID=502143 RepID=UPI0026064E98|nr:diguanylate cyclase [uncultured Neptuniibacter sp.]